MFKSVLTMLYLDRFGKCPDSLRDSLEGLINWLVLSQDKTDDWGSSAGYSLQKGWLISYPETTGYIIWTLLNYCQMIEKKKDIYDRIERMVKWEQQVQWEEGGIPGSYRQADEHMVVFNTGQVLMGWSAFIQSTKDKSVRDSAMRAGDWIGSCQDADGAWVRGVSKAATHGRLSYNAMVAWGLSELFLATEEERYREMALKGAYFCASLVEDSGWPDHCGFIEPKERYAPLTHNIGYTVQGILETGILLEDAGLLEVAQRMASGLAKGIDESGFIPGRIGPDYEKKANWVCLTGSAQIAYVWLRLADLEINEHYLEQALDVLGYIRKTQRVKTGNPGIDYAIRGSFPFSVNGYCRVTFPNWAAKFTVDCLLILQSLTKKGKFDRNLW